MTTEEKFLGVLIIGGMNLLLWVGAVVKVGNAPKDTDGCLLVGNSRTKDWVGSSLVTMGKLLTFYDKAKKEAEKSPKMQSVMKIIVVRDTETCNSTTGTFRVMMETGATEKKTDQGTLKMQVVIKENLPKAKTEPGSKP